MQVSAVIPVVGYAIHRSELTIRVREFERGAGARFRHR